MDNMISLADLLAMLVRQGKRILAAALLAALLFGGWSLWRQRSIASDGGHTQEDFEQELAIYEKKKQLLEDRIEHQETMLISQQEYIEKSLLMNMNPSQVYVAYMDLCITGVAGGDQRDYAYSTISSLYVSLWNQLDLTKSGTTGDLKSYEDPYVRELTEVTAEAGGIICLSVYADTASAAGKLLEEVYQGLLTQKAHVEEATAAHELSILQQTTKRVSGLEIAEKQSSRHKEIDALQASIDRQKQELDELRQPDAADFSNGWNLRSVIKYMILGGVLGGVVTCIWLILACLLGKTIESSHHAERNYGIGFIGALDRQKGIFSAWADKITRERIWKDPDRAAQYVTENTRMQLGEQKDVLFLSCEPIADKERISPTLEYLQKQGIHGRLADDFGHDAAALKALSDTAAVVLLVTIHRSRADDLMTIMKCAEQAHKPVIGFILI